MIDVGKNAKQARSQTTEWHGVFAAVTRPHLQLYRDVRPFLQIWKARRIAVNLLFAGSLSCLPGPAISFGAGLALLFAAGFAFFFAIFFALIGNFLPVLLIEVKAI